MRASPAGRFIESRNLKIDLGKRVSGMLDWQEQAVNTGQPGPLGGLSPIPQGVAPELTLSTLGATGLSAYFDMCDVGAVKQGDKVLASGAAGATGSAAAQIAKLRGPARVVGIAGGLLQCKWFLEETGLNGAIDFKSEGLLARLSEEFPKGVDLFCDNVAGPVLNGLLLRMA